MEDWSGTVSVLGKALGSSEGPPRVALTHRVDASCSQPGSRLLDGRRLVGSKNSALSTKPPPTHDLTPEHLSYSQAFL